MVFNFRHFDLLCVQSYFMNMILFIRYVCMVVYAFYILYVGINEPFIPIA